MKRLIVKIFVENWPRKLFSLILAIILYFTISQSMTTSRTISSIPVRIINLPTGKTVEGIDSSGVINKRYSLTLTGNKQLLEDIAPGDLEIEIDATGKPDEWVAVTSKRNLVSLNPDINLSRALKKVSSKNIIIKTTNLITEEVPIVITRPIGQDPKGYEYLDIWPYRIKTTISGPEEIVRQIKAQEPKLTFNLNDIPRKQLDELSSKQKRNDKDVVSFTVPDSWKQLYLPKLANHPIKIDDPSIKNLRIDFLRTDRIALGTNIPISLYFPLKNRFSPNKIALGSSKLINSLHGIKTITMPLYVQGVTSLFVQVVKDHLEIAIVVNPCDSNNALSWSVQFMNPRQLEDNYVRTVLQDAPTDDNQKVNNEMREEYIRNRFRNYMNRFTLLKPDFELFDLRPHLEGNTVVLGGEDSDAS